MRTALILFLAIIASACLAATESPLTVLISTEGRVSLVRGSTLLGEITPGLFEKEWRHAALAGPNLRDPVSREVRHGGINAPGGTRAVTELRPQILSDGVRLRYRLTPQSDIYLNSLHVSWDFDETTGTGAKFVADDAKGEIPEKRGQTHLRNAPMTDLRVQFREGGEVRFQFDNPTPVLIQDNRQWGPSFSVRMGPQMDGQEPWPAGKPCEIAFALTASGGVKVEYDDPVTIEAGDEWIPLKVDLDIEPGSALDFSGFGQFDPPAGKRGWVIATPDGHFAFEKDPKKTPRRFYGVNLCFSAHYITHEQADRLAERLMRIGYNAVRFHHYEMELVDRSGGTSTVLNRDKLDQVDYLFSALKKRGLYVTTDLYVSRPVFADEVFPGEAGDLGMDEFKMLVPVNAKAMKNWKDFARNLLIHVNPHTGLRYADDPALAWLSMINEGNFGNFVGSLSERARGEWEKAWNAWLHDRYGERPEAKTPWGKQPAFNIFLAETDRRMCREMRRFLRDEVGTEALLTNMNGWSNPIQNQASRQDYDYVDDHFYVDHPHFLEQPWRLPSRCENRSPVSQGAPGGRHCAFTRLLNKPFTLSEYNYSGPGRFRGVGGILTGCMAALQDWSVVWRFAYGHSRDTLFQPGAANYFDVVSDPLNQAAERASLCLFLRGDMRPARHSIGVAMTEKGLLDEAAPTP
ncbi:MAG: hypothetical protein HY318_11985, partial [Armatimonadetes bacterium]|nr:hypothetical protein [Armatimonadota bacterium]